MRKAMTLGLLAGAALSAQAMAADFTFPSFNQVVSSTVSNVALTGAPAGVYTSYSVSVQWSALSGGPWSEEAIFALTNQASLSGALFYADPGSASNGAGNGNSVTLTWTGFLDTAYTGGDPLFFQMQQTFGGSSANWNNISITLGMAAITAPTTLHDFGAVSGSATEKNQLAAGEVHWYSFEYDGVSPLSIDTLGSTLTPSVFGAPDDTEIALYNSAGALIDSNDDIDFDNDILLSGLSFAPGELAAGTYYIAATGYNGTFGNAFGASSTSQSTGSLRVNINVPAPAGAGVLAMAGLIAARRRRA